MPDEPVRHFFYGAAGTGKSRVIHAFMCFVNQWKCGRMIMITAPSGIAAVLLSEVLDATTYHSALGLRVVNQLPKKTVKAERKFTDIFAFFIDEVSMLSCSDFDRINWTLKQVKANYVQDFGGVDLFISGDFSQLGPPGGHPLFEKYYKMIVCPNHRIEAQMDGNLLFHNCINMVTVLTEVKHCTQGICCHVGALSNYRTYKIRYR